MCHPPHLRCGPMHGSSLLFCRPIRRARPTDQQNRQHSKTQDSRNPQQSNRLICMSSHSSHNHTVFVGRKTEIEKRRLYLGGKREKEKTVYYSPSLRTSRRQRYNAFATPHQNNNLINITPIHSFKEYAFVTGRLIVIISSYPGTPGIDIV